ncbi:MAG: GtrA family protein [Acidithiobacillus sp.]
MIKRKTLTEVFCFGLSGTAGFVVDAGIVAISTKEIWLNPISEQVIEFSVAVTVTWRINRHWTFAEQASEKWLHEWSR